VLFYGHTPHGRKGNLVVQAIALQINTQGMCLSFVVRALSIKMYTYRKVCGCVANRVKWVDCGCVGCEQFGELMSIYTSTPEEVFKNTVLMDAASVKKGAQTSDLKHQS